MRSHPVRLLRPNDLGLFDVHGNVWEWCQERSDDQGNVQRYDLDKEETVDGRMFRALRGGTFLNDPAGVASANLNGNPPEQRTGADGFRIARTLR
jgi:formylglycine-generating enzyme required for sulfatase activity